LTSEFFTKGNVMDTQNFELLLDGVPYMIRATPYEFNTETRFTVTFNGSTEYVFAYDPTLRRYAGLGDEAVDIPDTLEREISDRLFTLV
jgi:hypothetical protein